jgi:hypothetical protein
VEDGVKNDDDDVSSKDGAGATGGFIEDAAENLKKFSSNIDTNKMESPKSLNIITGTGISYRRPDGINVISLASLGK